MAVTLASPSLCFVRRSTQRGGGPLCSSTDKASEAESGKLGGTLHQPSEPWLLPHKWSEPYVPECEALRVGCAWKTPPSHLRGALETWAMIYYRAAWPAPAFQKFPFHFAQGKP